MDARTSRRSYSFDVEDAARWAAVWAQRHEVVVWTNGCFDLFHAGHVDAIQAAAAFGDHLIIGINTDQSVRRAKGPGRPVIPFDERAAIVTAIYCVDMVVGFDDPTPYESIEAIKPRVVVKGEDYAPGGLPMPERRLVEGYGGVVEYTPRSRTLCTSQIIERLRTA